MTQLHQLFYQLIFLLAIVMASLAVSAQPAFPTAPSPTVPANILPPPPSTVRSPVGFFRELLAMPPAEMMNSLTNRTPEARARILAKVHEYRMLSPDERELRLRSTELRWYLMPLFRMTPADRGTRLAQVPGELQDLVKSRLAAWDALSPSAQQEFLTNDVAMHIFSHVSMATNNPSADPAQEKMAEQFNQFFDLTPDERQQALNTLSDAERAQMENTLKTFDQLSPQQRHLCVRNYARFAGMSAAERSDFLKNADRWAKMSPQERQAWRNLVAQAPELPPTPPVIVPSNLMPPVHQPGKPFLTGMATNQS